MSESKPYYYFDLSGEKNPGINVQELVDSILAKVVVEEPVLNKSKDGKHEWVTSGVFYYPQGVGKDKPKGQLYLRVPKQYIFGINGTHPQDIADEDKTKDNADGLQIRYPMTSLKTVAEPSPKEAFAFALFDAIWKKTLEAGISFCKVPKDQRKLPATANNSYIAAKDGVKNQNDLNDPAWRDFIKPIYDYGKDKDGKVNKEKPQTCYIEFVTFVDKQTKKMRCDTKVYNEKNVRVLDPKIYYATFQDSCPGNADICVLWQDVYWGAHGKKEYGGSARLRVAEMNFVQVTNSRVVSDRLLPDSDPIVEIGGDNEYGSFLSPNGDGTTVESHFEDTSKSVEEPPKETTAKKPNVKPRNIKKKGGD